MFSLEGREETDLKKQILEFIVSEQREQSQQESITTAWSTTDPTGLHWLV